MKQNTKIDLPLLVARKLLGCMTSDDERILQMWVSASPENKKIYEKLCESDDLQSRMEEFDRLDLSELKSSLLDKIARKNETSNTQYKARRHRSFRKYLKYAAILLLPLAIAVTLLLHNVGNSSLIDIQKIDFAPGSRIAVLTTSDGEKISLSTDGEMNENGLSMINDSLALDYSSNASDSLSDMVYNVVSVPRGGEYQMYLPDGSKVWLNSETEFRFPKKFSQKNRHVFVDGEAYFEVKKSAIPFVVSTKSMNVTVLGTSFNINAYSSNDMIKTTLVDGSVEVENEVGDECLLIPGEQTVLEKTSGKMYKKKVNVNNYIAWKNKTFVFDEEKIRDIVKVLSRWYDVDIVVLSESLGEEVFYGVLPKYENISVILEMLKSINNIKYEIKENRVIIAK